MSLNKYSISYQTAEVSLNDYTASCVDTETFLGYCRQCCNYGRIWACPPLSFDPMEIWCAYDVLQLHAWILYPETSMTMEELMTAFQREKTELSDYVLKLEKETPGSLSLAASTCTKCIPCMRAQGKSCCHPDELRYSIEALGGDVGKTMEKYLHLPLQWIQDGKIPEYLAVVAGILKKT